MSLSSNSCPALVLNADYQPLSYFPLSTWSWKDSLKAVFLERVNVVSEYEQLVRSPSVKLKLPSVVSLKDYVPLPDNVAFTRFNVFLRDKFHANIVLKALKLSNLPLTMLYQGLWEEKQPGTTSLHLVVDAIHLRVINWLIKQI